MGLETTQRFVFAGAFAVEALVVLGVVLVVVIGAVGWWEYQRHRSRWLYVFLPLRFVALGVVLWMLAEPTLQTVRRRGSPKSVAVVVDSSQSMDVVDPGATSGQSARWAEALGERSGLLARMDEAAVALALARSSLAQLTAAMRSGMNPERARRALAQATQGVEAFQKSVRALKPNLPADQADIADELDAVLDRLTRQVVPKLDELNDDLGSEAFLESAERVERVMEVEQPMGELARRMRKAADRFADRYAEGPDARYLGGADAALSRREMARRLLDKAIPVWKRRMDQSTGLRQYQFAHEMTPLVENSPAEVPRANESDQAEYKTDIAGALNQLVQERSEARLGAVVMFTDGQHNAERDPVKAASAFEGLPLLLVPTGSVQHTHDVILNHLRAPRSVILEDAIMVDAMLNAHECLGEELEVQLLRDERVIQSRTITVNSPDFARRVAFRQEADELGSHDFTLRVEPTAEEQFTANNEAEFSVEVVENEIRVLLADQTPRWEHRFLRNLFKRDQTIEFDERLLEAQGSRWSPTDKGLPETEDEWARYRAVILGDIAPERLDVEQQAMLERYVGYRGGTLVIIAGRDFMPGAYIDRPFEKLLPIEPADSAWRDQAGFNLYLTEEGRRSPALQLAAEDVVNQRLWRELTQKLPLYSLSIHSQPKVNAHTLIAASLRAGSDRDGQSQRAFLCWQHYGRGRVVYLAAPVSYQLRLRRGDQYHHRFWGQLLRWAMTRDMGAGSKTVRLSTDKDRYTQGDGVQVTAWLSQTDGIAVSGAQSQLVVRRDGQEDATFGMEEDPDEPGAYRAVLEDLAPGPITIEITGNEVKDLLNREGALGRVETFVMIDSQDTRELSETRCNLPLLTQIAEAAGGAIVPPTALRSAISHLDLAPIISEDVSQQSLWDRWRFLWIFVGCLTVEWVIRKRLGMA